MKNTPLNAPRFALRKPYRILLCALANAVLLVFCFVEGGQWYLNGSAIADARENQVYLCTLSPRRDPQPESGGSVMENRVVSEEALEYLKSSPFVRELHTVRGHSGRLSSGRWMPTDGYPMDANQVFLFVGRVASKNEVLHTGRGQETGEIRLTLQPLCVCAGYEKHLTIPPTEASGIPILSIPDRTYYDFDSETGEVTVTEVIPAQDYGLEEGGRYLLACTGAGTAVNPLSLYFFAGPDGEELPAVWPEKPGDDALSDREFGEKIIREEGLSAIAASLDNAAALVTVQEIDAVDTLPVRQKELMRIMTGRELTRDDIGKNVCLLHVSDAASQGLRVGMSLPLSLSDRIYSQDLHCRGVPLPGDTELLDYGREEEYEVVGIFTYTEQPVSWDDADFGYAMEFLSSYRYPKGTVFIPTRKDDGASSSPLPTVWDFSFNVHKDLCGAFVKEAEGPLMDMGYELNVLAANYADVEEQLRELEKNGAGSVTVGLLGLAAGLAVSIALPLLFWRRDYAVERRLGAGMREARGVYRSAWLMTACISLPLSAAGLLILSLASDTLFPSVLRSAKAVGIMTLAAAAELLVLLLSVLLLSFLRDRKQFRG